MTIWVGYDGMLYDDEAQGGIYTGQDNGGLGGLGDIASSLGGTDAGSGGGFGSALSDLGSSFGSALGGGSGGGTDGGSGLGGIGSDLSNLFSGTGDTGSALGDVFGKLAKTALPAVTQAAEGALTKATQRSTPSQQRSIPSQQRSTSSQASTPSQQRSIPSQQISSHLATPGSGGGTPLHVRHKHDVDPKIRLNLVLSHLAKKYNLPPPAKPAGFVSKMMGHPT